MLLEYDFEGNSCHSFVADHPRTSGINGSTQPSQSLLTFIDIVSYVLQFFWERRPLRRLFGFQKVTKHFIDSFLAMPFQLDNEQCVYEFLAFFVFTGELILEVQMAIVPVYNLRLQVESLVNLKRFPVPRETANDEKMTIT